MNAPESGLAACNVCEPTLQQRIIDGDLRGLAVDTDEPARLVCGHAGCGSRPRQRTLRIVVDEHVAHRRQRPAEQLAAAHHAGGAITRRMLGAHFGRIDDLAGEDAQDLRELPGVDDRSLHLLVIPQALERIVELDAVFDTARRVLARNGLLAFHIDASRVRGGDTAPTRPGEGRIAVGIGWLLEALADRDLEPNYLRLEDPFSGAPAPWFIARRLERSARSRPR